MSAVSLRRFGIIAATLFFGVAAHAPRPHADEHGRVRRTPPTHDQLARRASEEAMNDSILRKGDVISTDRGFLLFRGYGTDGSPEFVPVPNPLEAAKK